MTHLFKKAALLVAVVSLGSASAVSFKDVVGKVDKAQRAFLNFNSKKGAATVLTVLAANGLVQAGLPKFESPGSCWAPYNVGKAGVVALGSSLNSVETSFLKMPSFDLKLAGKWPFKMGSLKKAGYVSGVARVATYAALVAATVNTYRDARDAKAAKKADAQA